MTNNRKEKRPPRYENDDYVLRALYKLLSKYFGTKRSPSNPSYSQRPPRRGSGGGTGGYRGSSGSRGSYAPRSYRPSYSHGQGSPSTPPRRPEPSYPRESRPYVQSLPQPRTEPDTEELLRRLEQKVDDRLLEKVMERLEAESKAVEEAVKADSTEPETTETADGVAPRSGESIALETKQETESVEAGMAEQEANPVAEPEPLESDLYDRLDPSGLDWLGEELEGLTVEVTDLDTEPVTPSLELLDDVAPDIVNDLAPKSAGLVKPELELAKLFEPLSELVDPLKPLEPGIAELEEEAEEAEPI